MTYQDYLDNWDSNFGVADTGEYASYHYGKRRLNDVHRLSEDEFNKHLKALNVASEHFDKALASDDGAGMDAALSESFPHELALLL